MIIDWVQLALNIRAAGLPLRRADARIGRHLDFVGKIARGEIQEPKFSDGLALLNLHVDVCGVERTAGLNVQLLKNDIHGIGSVTKGTI